MKTALIPFLLLCAFLMYGQTPQLVVPIGHTDYISAVAISSVAGERYILTGSADFTAKLWDQYGREIQTFRGHNAALTAVAFSPDGKHVLTASQDATARLWDLNGVELARFVDEEIGEESLFSGNGITVFHAIKCLAFSPDNKYILTGRRNGIAQLWDMSGREIRAFKDRRLQQREYDQNSDWADFAAISLEGVQSVAFSPDGQQVRTTTLLRTNWWNITGEKIKEEPICANLEQHNEPRDRLLNIGAYPNEQSGERGQEIAYGSDDQTFVTVCDSVAKLVVNGTEVKSFGQRFDRLSSIQFSPDGKYFLTDHRDSLTLWDLQGKRLRSFCGSGGRISNVPAFSDDSKSIFIVCADVASLWDLNGELLQTFQGYSQAAWGKFSPDGRYIDFSTSSRTLNMWDLETNRIQILGMDPTAKERPAFATTKNALLLVGEDSIKIWDRAGAHINTLEHEKDQAAFLNEGKFVLLFDRFGGVIRDLYGEKAEVFTDDNLEVDDLYFEYTNQNIILSAIGKEDVFENSKVWNKDGKFLRTLSEEQLEQLPFILNPEGTYAVTESAKLLNFQKKNARSISLLDPAVQKKYEDEDDDRLEPEDRIFRADFSPDHKHFLTVNNQNLLKYWDLNGKKIWTKTTHFGYLRSAGFSPDGQYILTSGEFDHSLKLWEAASGRELAILHMLDSTEWVVSTRSGLFDASPGAMQRMHYKVGLEVIELEQLKERYYEPGLLQKLLGFSSEPLRTVSGFDTIGLYPKIKLELDTQQNQLRLHLSPRNGGVGKVSVFVNGKEIIEDANPPEGYEKIRDTVLTVELDKYARYFLFDTLNTVSVRAYNEAGWLKSSPRAVVYEPAFAQSKGTDKSTGSKKNTGLRRKPALYVISVGTADYAGKDLQLKYSAKDARDMAEAIRQVSSQLFGADSVTISLLTTDADDPTRQPAKTNIKSAFDQIKSRAKAEDILVVYFSGHGVSYGDADQALFYYLTKDISSENLSDAGVRANRTISSAELTRWITDIPAQKQVLILDACNSGRVVEKLTAGRKALNSSQIRALDRMKDRTGMFVLTGSAADKVSYEAGQYGQGLLTYSLLQGIKSMVDKNVDVSALFEHARNTVPQLAKGIGGIQVPMLVGPTGGSFDIGVVNDSVQIKLEEVKPVFIRNNFQDADNYGDPLGLTRELENYFQELTLNDAQAEIIYLDVAEYENAYSIKGLYSVKGDAVTVQGRLFKGEKAIGEEFQVPGKKDQLAALAEAIVDKASEMLE